MTTREKIVGIVTLLALAWLVNTFEPADSGGEISSFLHILSEKQEVSSNNMVEEIVSGAEGSLVGEHVVDGSNWSIPNIVRHYLGGD